MITIVQGGQYGSEAKGTIAGWLAQTRPYDYAVRTGAINAGHTVYFNNKPYVNQQIPVAWVNPNTKLVIGPGAYIHKATLDREIEMVKAATGIDPRDRLLIDYRAAVHSDEYMFEAKAADRHTLIGATGKGCAEAVIHKIRDRAKQRLIFSDLYPSSYHYADTSALLMSASDAGALVMLEGTQGELLDFHLGPWPYVTSRQTTPAAWMAEAGLSPVLNTEIVLVMRTMPIRVAGNSGPMDNETSWVVLARYINSRLDSMGIGDHPMRVDNDALNEFSDRSAKYLFDRGLYVSPHELDPEYRVKYASALSEYARVAMDGMSERHLQSLRKLFEMTTVTKKLRRIAYWSSTQADYTIGMLKPSAVVVTFLNYVFPECYGVAPSEEALTWVRTMCPRARWVSTGPNPNNIYRVEV